MLGGFRYFDQALLLDISGYVTCHLIFCTLQNTNLQNAEYAWEMDYYKTMSKIHFSAIFT